MRRFAIPRQRAGAATSTLRVPEASDVRLRTTVGTSSCVVSIVGMSFFQLLAASLPSLSSSVPMPLLSLCSRRRCLRHRSLVARSLSDNVVCDGSLSISR